MPEYFYYAVYQPRPRVICVRGGTETVELDFCSSFAIANQMAHLYNLNRVGAI
jgi:hypothetical protein